MRPVLAELDLETGAGPARRLRLLHITPSYHPAVRYGGPIVSVHGLCCALAARGHDVHVFTTNIDGAGESGAPLDASVDLDGVKVRYFPAGLGRRLFRAPEMARALEREIAGFDAAHLHSVFLWPTTIGARIARRQGTPYLLSPRGMLVKTLVEARSPWAKRAWIEAFERANVAGAASLHVTSELEAAHLGPFGFNTRRIDVIANGVDPPPFYANSNGQTRARRVVYIGRLSWKKRIDCLIRALAFAPGAELVIAGFDDENLRPTLEALARELDLEGRVRFIAPVVGAQKWRLLRDCEVFVLPSTQENFGLAALEAMASGLPVIAAPGVGLASAIVEAGAGLCVENDPHVLGHALARLLADESARMRMGAAGRELALSKYSWAAIAAQMEQAYLRAIAER